LGGVKRLGGKTGGRKPLASWGGEGGKGMTDYCTKAKGKNGGRGHKAEKGRKQSKKHYGGEGRNSHKSGKKSHRRKGVCVWVKRLVMDCAGKKRGGPKRTVPG